MTTFAEVAPRLARAYYAERERLRIQLIIEKALPELEAEFTGYDFDFLIPLGDNWLWAWTWARRLEGKTGVDHQAALHAAYTRYFAGKN